MTKALEDLQAGRDPFAAAYENEPDPQPYYTAANLCLWLPIIAAVFCKAASEAIKAMDLPHPVVALGIGGIACLLMAGGLIAGIVALCGIGKHGTERILIRSLIGMCLSGLLLLVFVTGVVTGFQNARRNHDLAGSVTTASKKLAADMKQDLNNGKELTAARQELRLEGMQQTLEATAANATGDTALMAKASAAYLQRLQPVMREYTDAIKSWHDAPVLEMSGVVAREQLQGKKAQVQRFLAANEKLITLTSNPEQRYREELDKAGVSAKSVEAAMAGARKVIASNPGLTTKIREDDRRIGNAMLGMLEVLDQNWGRWRYDSQRQKTIFQDDAALDKYVSLRDEMDAAGKEQKRLQMQLVSRASL